MSRPAGLARILSVLADRNYAIWMAGNAISLIGMWAQRIGIGWLAWELTHSAFWVGIVAAADLAPGIIVTPFAGIIGDRRNRLTLVRQAQAVSALVSAVMAAVVLTGSAGIVLLTVLATVQGITMAFKQPARMALTKDLVEARHIGTAVALNAVVFNLARFIGPTVAGVLILAEGVGSVFVFAVLGSTTFVVALQFVALRRTAGTAAPDEAAEALPPLTGTGYAYAFSHAGIGPLLILTLANGMLIRGFVEVLPGYSAAVLESGAEGLAALSASIGFGSIVAGLWLAQRDGIAGLTRQIFLTQAVASVLIVILAGTGSLAVAVILVGLAGFMLAVNGIGAQTLVQRCTPEDRLARVLAIFGLITRGSPAAGALLVGAAADLVGFAIPLVVTGMLSLGVVALLIRREPTVRAAMEMAGRQRA
jgi:MFS family permease